jgi:uncharacterized membrane protein
MFSLKLFAIVFIVGIILDIIWIGFIIGDFFKQELGDLYVPKFSLAAVLAYVVMSAAIVFFVLQHPSVTSVKTAIYVGALFGFTLYAVYDFTNLAILKTYSIKFMVVDILWGTFLGGVVSGVGKYFA